MGAEDPLSIVFGFNGTDMLNLAIKGCLADGDHVIATMLEHNSVLRVLCELLERGAIELTRYGRVRTALSTPRTCAARCEATRA